jgi:NAD(P)H-flavin reductase
VANPYIPELALIKDIKVESPEAKTFTVCLKEEKPFNYKPGQFVEVSLFGYGEFPVSVSEIVDMKKGSFQITVRQVGKLTHQLMEMPVNSVIGIRGPFGNGFPMEEMEGRDILLVAGGIGLSPIKYAVDYLLKNRDKYRSLKFLYGATSPSVILFKDTMASWSEEGQKKGLEVLLTVDIAEDGWQGNVGMVTDLFDRVQLDPPRTSAIICGPGVMMKAATTRLISRGFAEDQLFMSLERRMQCGMGMCGHCMIGQKRVCLDGPVFAYKDVNDTLERLF